MKWQSVACEIVSNLETRNALIQSDKDQILNLISDNNSVEAFRTTYGKIIPDWKIGWNKIWRGNDLIGWYGTTLTIQPIRSVAFEIESASDEGEAVRNWLTRLYNTLSMDPEDPQNRLLAEFGFEPGDFDWDKPKLKLLQRLNLDQHDKPAIERWRWSKNNGLAYTTDDGRFQVTRDLVWARAIETGIKSAGGTSKPLREFLLDLDKNVKEIAFSTSINDIGLDACIQILSFYGFVHRMIDRVRFSVSPGDFPLNAIQLWD